MPTKILLAIAFFSISFFSNAQDESLLVVATIPSELTTKANAVVRYDDTNVEVKAYNKMVYTNTRVVTVFNKEGNNNHRAVVHYDKNINIKTLEARIYNSNGKEIKKIKKNDFEDVSAVSGGTLYSDSRVKYLEYTPISYPYTVKLEVEVEYSSTAFLPGWRPLEGFYVSTQNSNYKITNSSGVEVKVKTSNFDDYNIEKHSEFHYSAKNLISAKPEAYRPAFKTFAPSLKAALTQFDMEGVEGVNNDWTDFGKWMYDKLLTGTDALPDKVKTEIKALTASAANDIEKAKIVYSYLQEKTRYISVQVGIGGWKPMLAQDVDRLGYADCKGLTNYTKALLNEVGVESYYAVIYGDRDIVSIDKEFSATEGNHVVLCLPNEEDYIWLECTSQTNPFGFIAGFTDDRDALLITPEGGKIVHTTVYKTEESLQETKANINLDSQGSISGNVNIQTEGYQYALHEGIQNRPTREQDLYFKKYWDYLNNLNIDKIEFINDKDNVVFTENVDILATNYATKSGKRLLFQPNVFNRVTNIPTRYKNRTLDFEIERGFVDKDEFVINIDPTLQIEAMPDSVVITNKFGSYEFSIEKRSDSELLYKRTYVLNKGYYSKEEYEEFRTFRANVVKHDKTKIVFVTKP